MLLIAFLVVGPRDLPKVARWLGRAVKKIRQMIREIKKETGWDELEKEFKDTQTDVDQTFKDLQKDMDISSELKSAAADWNRNVKEVQETLRQAEQQTKDEEKKEEKKDEKK